MIRNAAVNLKEPWPGRKAKERGRRGVPRPARLVEGAFYDECEARGVEPVIPIRGAKANQPVLPVAVGGRMFPRIARGTERFKNLYRGRAAVEREFARLKNEHGLASFRVRGADRVALHADLTMLARLGQALAWERQKGILVAT